MSGGYSQSLSRVMDRDDLQGAWKGVENIKNPSIDVTDEYLIFKKGKILHLQAKSNFLSELYFGFQQVTSSTESIPDNFSMNDLKKRGNRFIQGLISGGNNPIFNSIDWFFYDESSLTMAYMEYEKVKKMDINSLNFLKNMGLRNRRNYIEEYLTINYKKIVKPKIFLYTTFTQISNSYLILNDAVEVIEVKGEWAKIRYYGGKKIIEGWVKVSDVN